MRDVITALIGAAFCAGIGPARAQIHGTYDPSADMLGIIVSGVLVALAMAMLALSFRPRSSR